MEAMIITEIRPLIPVMQVGETIPLYFMIPASTPVIVVPAPEAHVDMHRALTQADRIYSRSEAIYLSGCPRCTGALVWIVPSNGSGEMIAVHDHLVQPVPLN